LSSSIWLYLLDSPGLMFPCVLEGDESLQDHVGDAWLAGWTFDLLLTCSQLCAAGPRGSEKGASGDCGTARSMVADFLVPLLLSNDIFLLLVLISAFLFELCNWMSILGKLVSGSWGVCCTKLQELSVDICSIGCGKEDGFGMDGSSDPDVWHVWHIWAAIVAGQTRILHSPSPK
jgi:hypothetical protein